MLYFSQVVRSCVRIFKIKSFVRYAQRAEITDRVLCTAIEHAERGLIDADLGGNVIKQRIARPGQGQSKGYRAIIAYKYQNEPYSFTALRKTNETT